MPYYKQSSQQQEEQKLGMRKYAKYDRSFMLFGSAMNGLQGYITILENDSEKTENHKSKDEKAKELIQWAWDWARNSTSSYVDELYDEEAKKQAAQAKSKDVGKEDAELDTIQTIE